MKDTQKSKYFDPNKSFFSLKIVSAAIASVTTASLLLATIIIINSNLELDLSYNGINNLLTIFKIPISILATLIPILAVFATNHISEQSKESNRLAKEQNIFANFYAHIEFFERYITAYQSKRINNIKARKLHNFLFPNAKYGEYRVSPQEVLNIIKTIVKLLKPIKLHTIDPSINFSEADQSGMLDKATEIHLTLLEFAEENIFDKTETFIKAPKTRELFSDVFLIPLNSAWILTELLRHACSFDPHYDLTSLIKLETAFSTIMASNETALKNIEATQKYFSQESMDLFEIE